ncbi:MAG: nucleotide sugar dehydrogenase [Candidatus Wallbacteria bacterium]|nr:nucleotide sugar dehydrogenase [Candidatus Wallbacteria bacterium]
MSENGHGRKISVVGLGYVGLPVAVAFGKRGPTVGFDVDRRRIEELKKRHDRRNEVKSDELGQADILLTADPADLKRADFHIVAVPTPIDEARRPDLRPILGAAEIVGHQLKAGDIVVFESTVYPGLTEEECVPVLEKTSGLRCGVDFTVGYSPERINPGDPEHDFERITKVVSGLDARTLELVAAVYGSVVKAGVHRAPSIKTAEAAKVIENTQRDLNIALMNELAIIFHHLGMDTGDVLAAARTKWNFLPFSPGLVGGHCIGVDPYYLTHKAEQADYHPEVILAGRKINDSMGRYVAAELVKRLLKNGRQSSRSLRVTVLGVTFKEDVRDVRNTRVTDIIRELKEYGIAVQLHDPVADPDDARRECGQELLAVEQLQPADGVIMAVRHAPFRRAGWTFVQSLLQEGQGVVADIRDCLERSKTPAGVDLWRL